MYVFAKAMADQGLNVCFIRDRSDRYPMSQPIWEDIRFSLPHEEMLRASFWPWSRWGELEKDLRWEVPSWLYDPLSEPGGDATVTSSNRQGLIDSVFLHRYVRAPYRAPVLRKMKTCDALVVCGVEGSILASASGRPYVLYPHGGDLLIAAGLLQPELHRVRSRIRHAMLRRQLVIAYSNVICIGAHEPTAFSADYYGAEPFFRKHKNCFLPMPIPVRKRASRSERRRALHQLLAELRLEMPSNEYIGFVPSRVDFEWKGQDRLLHAIGHLGRAGKLPDIHLIFSGWGNDLGTAQQLVQSEGLQKRITFLECALSKPLLYEFYLAADFVVDQFIVGMCGTSAVEAMACGAPLVTWINKDVERPWGAPPVLQARFEDDIVTLLSDFDRLDFEQIGALLQEWMERVYNPSVVARKLTDIFPNA